MSTPSERPPPPYRPAAAAVTAALGDVLVSVCGERSLARAWGRLSPSARRLAASAAAKAAAAAVTDGNEPPPGFPDVARLVATSRVEAAALLEGWQWAEFPEPWMGVDSPLAPGMTLTGWQVLGRSVVDLVAVEAVDQGAEVVVRGPDRRISRVPLDRLLVGGVHAAPPGGLARRRSAFDAFLASNPTLRLTSGLRPLGSPSLVHAFTCPACGYPTRTPSLGGPMRRTQVLVDPSACPLCGWSDAEGFDDGSARDPSFANGGYSLADARANVERFGTMFDLSDESRLARKHRKRKVRRRRERACALLRGVLRLPDASYEQFEAWRAAFFVLDGMPGSVRAPLHVCVLPERRASSRAERSPVLGVLGPSVDEESV